jgi:hypothetical protein
MQHGWIVSVSEAEGQKNPEVQQDGASQAAAEAPRPAEPLVPSFLLVGTDPAAFVLMVLWIELHERMGTINRNTATASGQLASNMEHCARSLGLDTGRAVQAWFEISRSLCLPEQEAPKAPDPAQFMVDGILDRDAYAAAEVSYRRAMH